MFHQAAERLALARTYAHEIMAQVHGSFDYSSPRAGSGAIRIVYICRCVA
jgi:hypothetical protein